MRALFYLLFFFFSYKFKTILKNMQKKYKSVRKQRQTDLHELKGILIYITRSNQPGLYSEILPQNLDKGRKLS